MRISPLFPGKSSRPEVFCQKYILGNFAKSKIVLEYYSKKNPAQAFRTTFLKNTCEQLLLSWVFSEIFRIAFCKNIWRNCFRYKTVTIMVFKYQYLLENMCNEKITWEGKSKAKKKVVSTTLSTEFWKKKELGENFLLRIISLALHLLVSS